MRTVPALVSSVNLFLVLLRDHDWVMPAEAETVGDGYTHILTAGHVGHIVEVAFRVWVFVVDRRVDEAAVDGQQSRDRLHRAGRAEQVADHRLGAADRDSVGVVAEGELQRLGLTGTVELGRLAAGMDLA